jgi:LacI family transcriptional regulator
VDKLNYVPNPYASSLRKRKSKTIAVVLPEVADSFFSLAINGIEAVAQEKGYHVLIYLTHESFSKEENILKDFKSGRVDGILISVSRETTQGSHICDVQTLGIPVVFFDRVCEEVETAKVILKVGMLQQNISLKRMRPDSLFIHFKHFVHRKQANGGLL